MILAIAAQKLLLQIAKRRETRMRLMVTGGAGFIGSAVVRKAIADGHDVLNVDKLTYAANLDNIALVADSSAYTFAQKDICDQAAMAALIADFKPDAIMNLAAEIFGSEVAT